MRMSDISRKIDFVVNSTRMAKMKVQMGSASCHLRSSCKSCAGQMYITILPDKQRLCRASGH